MTIFSLDTRRMNSWVAGRGVVAEAEEALGLVKGPAGLTEMIRSQN